VSGWCCSRQRACCGRNSSRMKRRTVSRYIDTASVCQCGVGLSVDTSAHYLRRKGRARQGAWRLRAPTAPVASEKLTRLCSRIERPRLHPIMICPNFGQIRQSSRTHRMAPAVWKRAARARPGSTNAITVLHDTVSTVPSTVSRETRLRCSKQLRRVEFLCM
jgi:hypothetical protein